MKEPQHQHQDQTPDTRPPQELSAAAPSEASEGKTPPGAETAPPKGRLFVRFFAGVLIAAAVFAGGAAYSLYQQVQSLDSYVPRARTEPYELRTGTRAGEVIADLTAGSFHQAAVWIYVKLHSAELSLIQKGSYSVDGTLTLGEILRQMQRGDIMEQKPLTVALIEGMNARQFEKRLEAAADLRHDAAACFADPRSFMQETLGPADLEFLGGARDSLEGLLLPATYPYFKDDSARALLQRSMRSMLQLLTRQYPDASELMTLDSPYEVLIMASIVEKESSLAQEMPQIAGVFFNRLQRGMRLQTDAAVMYGVGPDFRGPLTARQLRQDTPYNTYTRDGLPPTPIAMPSAAAVRAVLHPADTDALYFVARSFDPADGHNFAVTLREHNRNVAAYKKSVRTYKAEQAAAAKAAAAARDSAAAAGDSGSGGT